MLDYVIVTVSSYITTDDNRDFPIPIGSSNNHFLSSANHRIQPGPLMAFSRSPSSPILGRHMSLRGHLLRKPSTQNSVRDEYPETVAPTNSHTPSSMRKLRFFQRRPCRHASQPGSTTKVLNRTASTPAVSRPTLTIETKEGTYFPTWPSDDFPSSRQEEFST